MELNTGSSTGENTEGRWEQAAGARQEFDYTDPVQSFIGTIRSIVTTPVGFFSGMARQGDYINPLIFALIGVEIYAVVAGIVGILGAATGFESVGGAFGTLFLLIILMPVLGSISLFVAAGIYQLLVMLVVKPEGTGFETTFRVWAYSVTPGLLVAWIPILGLIAAVVWSYVLAALGIREAHSTTTGKAAAVVLIPAAVGAVLSIIVGLIIWALILTAFNSVGGY